jgi:hypothetical protein
MNQAGELLFYKHDLNAMLEKKERELAQEIDRIEANKLLNSSVNDWVDFFEKKYLVDFIILKEDAVAVDQRETRIDVSQDTDRVIFDRSRPFYLAGTSVTFYLPYDGDSLLFQCRPSTHSFNPLRAEITANELRLCFDTTNHDPDRIKKQFESNLSQIKQYLAWAKKDVDLFNSSLKEKIINRINSRRQKLLADQGLVASLGYPLKRAKDNPATYTVPQIQRKIALQMPTVSDVAFEPEPTLDEKEYENILSIISNMVHVMERSPRAFSTMGEEDLRQHFLVQLNGQYQGQATGETFNSSGKTDILIRYEDKNIFIAECKIWKGAKEFNSAIDQLLGYTSWRDTKTAIIIFNRNKNTSQVIAKIPEIVEAHENYKRRIRYDHESAFRYIFGQKNDKNREIILTVLVFDVPKEENSENQ